MLKTHLRLGKVFGVPVRIDASWLLIFVWVTWSLAGGYFPRHYPGWSSTLSWGIGLLTSLLFFVSVLLHELGHALVAHAMGTQVREITLFLFGGMAEIADEPASAGRELKMAVAGPLVSLGLSALFGILHLATQGLSQPVSAIGLYLAGINLTLGVFNLVPGFPLDGGRVLRAILWRVRRDLAWATRWASRIGQGVAYLFIILGIARAFGGDWVNGLWVAFIGLFLDNAARSAYYQLGLRNLLRGHTVSEVMTAECIVVPPQLTLDVLVEQYLIPTGRRCFAVGSQGKILGLLTIHNIRAVPRERWRETHAGEALTPLDQLRVVSPLTPLWEALQGMTAEGVNQLPVVSDGVLAGMLTREHLLTYIRNRSELGV